MADDSTVSVPKALLAAVLDQAESDSYSTQAEFSCGWKGEDEKYEADRVKIRELRKIAGLEPGDVSGQGFFGIVLATTTENK